MNNDNNKEEKDIKEVFNEVLGGDRDYFWEMEYMNDYDMLRFANECLKNATDRLEKYLDDVEIKKEYIELNNIIMQVQSIIKNYK